MSDEPDDRRSRPTDGNGPSLFLILMVIVAALAAVFVFQNSGRGQIRFLFWEGDFRVWTALGLAVLLGMLLDRLIVMWWRRARRDGDG